MRERRYQQHTTRPSTQARRPAAQELRAGVPRRTAPATSGWGAAGGVGMLPIYLLILLALLATGAYITLDRLTADRILPNVRVHGLALGGMTEVEATTAVRARYSPWLQNPVTLTYGGQRFTPAPDDLGVAIDLERSVGDAYALGRSLNPLQSLRQYYTAWRYGMELPLYVRVDEVQLRRYLHGLAAQIERGPRDAELTVEGVEVRAAPSVEGQQALIDATAAEVLGALEALSPATIAFQSRPLPPRLTSEEVMPLAEQIGTLLSAPVTLQLGDKSWTMEREELAGLLRLQRGDGTVSASLDREAIRARVEAISREVTREPREPKLRFANGALEILVPGSDGASVDGDASVALLEEALWQQERSVALVGSVVRPGATPENLASLGIAELVAEGKSAFPGSANYRITNIVNGARLIDGTLIPPGGVFSFNELVEPVDESNGFVPGLAIVNNRTQQEWGGGLCQVSTTVFRAAFWAGLPIDERHEHQFRIGWYEIYEPIGMDAAIFTGPGGDNLRFTNDTGNWLLMQTEIDPANVTMYVRLYGTRPNRQVIRGEPVISRWLPAPQKPVYINDPSLPAGTLRHTDIAQQGLEMSISRTVLQGDQVVRQDTFATRFDPWPNIYVRGTGR